MACISLTGGALEFHSKFWPYFRFNTRSIGRLYAVTSNGLMDHWTLRAHSICGKQFYYYAYSAENDQHASRSYYFCADSIGSLNRKLGFDPLHSIDGSSDGFGKAIIY